RSRVQTHSITEHLRDVRQLHAWSSVGASGEDANVLRRNDVLGHCVQSALIELSAHALEELDVLVDRGRQHAGSTIVEVEATRAQRGKKTGPNVCGKGRPPRITKRLGCSNDSGNIDVRQIRQRLR